MCLSVFFSSIKYQVTVLQTLNQRVEPTSERLVLPVFKFRSESLKVYFPSPYLNRETCEPKFVSDFIQHVHNKNWEIFLLQCVSVKWLNKSASVVWIFISLFSILRWPTYGPLFNTYIIHNISLNVQTLAFTT